MEEREERGEERRERRGEERRGEERGEEREERRGEEVQLLNERWKRHAKGTCEA